MSFANMKDRPFPSTAFYSPSVCSSSCSFIWNQQKILRMKQHQDLWPFLVQSPPPWHFTSAHLGWCKLQELQRQRPVPCGQCTDGRADPDDVWLSISPMVEGSCLDGKSQGIIGHQWIASNLATSYVTAWSCLGVLSLVRQAFLQQLPTRNIRYYRDRGSFA